MLRRMKSGASELIVPLIDGLFASEHSIGNRIPLHVYLHRSTITHTENDMQKLANNAAESFLQRIREELRELGIGDDDSGEVNGGDAVDYLNELLVQLDNFLR